MIWECAELLASELWPEGIPPGCKPGPFIQQRKEMVHLLSQPNLQHATPLTIGSQHKDLVRMWYETVVTYSQMNLTKASDTLFAIRGLADLMRTHFNMQYFCGHWEKGFVPSLIWSGRSARRGTAQPQIAPSWSWASVQDVNFDIQHSWEDTDSLVAEFLGATLDNPRAPEYCCLQLRGQVYRIGSGAGDMLSLSEFDGSVSINVQSEDSTMKVWNDEYDDLYLSCRIDAHRLESFKIEDYIDTQVVIVPSEFDDKDKRWHTLRSDEHTGALFCIWLWVDEHTTHGLLLRQVGVQAQFEGCDRPICERLGTIWRMTGNDTLKILKGADSGREAQELYLV